MVLNKPNREIPIMESIKREILLLQKDAVVEIAEMCVPGFNRFVFKFKPDVILTFPFTCEGFSRWYYLFKFILGSKIISLRAEGAVDFSSETNIEWAVGFDNYGATLVDYELFWGEKLANVVGQKLLLKNKLLSLDRTKVVGYPRIESYFGEKQLILLPERFRELINSYKKDQLVLFATGFHLGNYRRQDLFDAKDLDVVNKLDELLEGVEISKRYRSEWIKNILEAAAKNPDSLIIVKKHPIEKREDYKELESARNVLLIYEDIQIDEIVPFVGIFFHYGSTALVDAYLSKISAIYVFSEKNKHWYTDLGWPSTKRIHVDEIPKTVAKFLAGEIVYEESPDIKRVLNDVFGLNDPNTYKPSAEIAKILLDPSPILKVSLMDKFLVIAAVMVVINPIRWRVVGLFRRTIKVWNRLLS